MNRATLALAALLALFAGACGKSIGDDCLTNVECNPNGNRSCDLSQPGGYCTVEGCDEDSCPDDSACVRIFPERYLTKPCDPVCEDLPCANGRDDCAADELCLDDGLCARRASERRFCAKTCGDDGDCRDGYVCRLAGTGGTLPLPSDAQFRFCAP